MVRIASNTAGLKLIVAYKLAKAAVMALLTVLLLRAHLHGQLVDFAEQLGDWFDRTDALDGFGDHLAHFFWHIASSQNAARFVALIALDTVSTAVEGVGLHYRQRWAAWLVVVATAFLIPLEVRGLFHHATVLRAAVLLINVVIVVYLAWRVLAHERRTAHA